MGLFFWKLLDCCFRYPTFLLHGVWKLWINFHVTFCVFPCDNILKVALFYVLEPSGWTLWSMKFTSQIFPFRHFVESTLIKEELIDDKSSKMKLKFQNKILCLEQCWTRRNYVEKPTIKVHGRFSMYSFH